MEISQYDYVKAFTSYRLNNIRVFFVKKKHERFCANTGYNHLLPQCFHTDRYYQCASSKPLKKFRQKTALVFFNRRRWWYGPGFMSAMSVVDWLMRPGGTLTPCPTFFFNSPAFYFLNFGPKDLFPLLKVIPYVGKTLSLTAQFMVWSNSAQARKCASEKSTLALKPRADVTRSPKQGYQWPHKKDSCPTKILKKNVGRQIDQRWMSVAIGISTFFSNLWFFLMLIKCKLVSRFLESYISLLEKKLLPDRFYFFGICWKRVSYKHVSGQMVYPTFKLLIIKNFTAKLKFKRRSISFRLFCCVLISL